MPLDPQLTGAPVVRREARDKVTGAARYAAEHTPPGTLYAWPVPATIAAGRVTAVRAVDALAVPGVHTVLTHDNAPRLAEPDDPILAVLQSDRVPHHGWTVALVVADSPEAARTGAGRLLVEYESTEHDVILTEDHPGLYTPEEANGGFPAVRKRGDFERSFAAAPVQVDATYRMVPLHNHPMEPHAATAWWEDGHLTVHDSSQGSNAVRKSLAQVFGLHPDRITVRSEHVGGGFGSKGTTRPQPVLAAMAARHTGHPVKTVFPRAQLAEVVGHRAPTIQRVRLGADLDGTLHAVSQEIVTQTSTLKEFVEQAAVPARVMYGSPDSTTVHRVVALDVPSPSWMRAPGEASGMYALESAMDELASALGMDPVELRLLNDPAAEPDSGRPFSSRGLAACLREGADRFGWQGRDPRPAARQEGRWLLGTGVASATYPVLVSRSAARAHAAADGTFRIEVNATDIGTGARTVLAQIAASALGVDVESVEVAIGSTDLPTAPLAGGSSGTASWGWAVHKAASGLADRLAGHRGRCPPKGSPPPPTPRRRPPPTPRTPGTPSAPTSPRRPSTPSPARSGCAGSSGCTRPGRSSTPVPPAPSSSAAWSWAWAWRSPRGPPSTRSSGTSPRRTSPPTTCRSTPTRSTSRPTGSTRTTTTSTRWAPRASGRSASSARPPPSATRSAMPPGPGSANCP